MKSKRAKIAVSTEHIFPIIKKWLYSEREIFLRELVSNASDAITKHRRLVSLGKAEEASDARLCYRRGGSVLTFTLRDGRVSGIMLSGE